MRKATPAGWKLVHIKPPTQSLFVIVTLSLHKDLLRRKLSPYQITPAFYQLVVTPFIQLGGRSTMRICPRTQHNDPKHEHMYLVWNHFCWYGHCQKVLFDVSLIFWFTSLVIRTLRNCPRTSRSDSNALTTYKWPQVSVNNDGFLLLHCATQKEYPLLAHSELKAQ